MYQVDDKTSQIFFAQVLVGDSINLPPKPYTIANLRKDESAPGKEKFSFEYYDSIAVCNF